jgi:LPS-assembly lipoprotein
MRFAGQKKHQPYRCWLTYRVCCLGLAMLLAGCGFSLRSATPLPFKTLYLGIPDTTRFGAQVRRAVQAAARDTVLVNDPKEADAVLQVVRNERTLNPSSLNAQGRVNEYVLGILFTFRLIDRSGAVLVPDTTLTVFRDLPYDDQLVQAKQSEIETLYRSMQQSLVDRLIRRLAAPIVAPEAPTAAQSEDEKPTVDDPEEVFATGRQAPLPWQEPSIHRVPGRID